MGVQIQGDTGNVIATKGTYSGNVTIGGTLTYEDVTNIDSVGLITAREGIEVGARPGVAASVSVDGNAIFSGIVTATEFKGDGSGLTGVANTNVIFTDKLQVGDSPELISVGVGSDLQIFHLSDSSYIKHTPSSTLFVQSGSNIVLENTDGTNYVRAVSGGAAELYHSGTKKLETASGGVTVTGTLAATAVTGDGSALTGLTAGITQYDIWRITSNLALQTSGTIISANWERADNATATYIGNGMSESSGVFTFPVTGKWEIRVDGCLNSNDGEMHYGQVDVMISSDSGSSYDRVSRALGGVASGGAYGNLSTTCLIDVTNASTFRCKFDALASNSNQSYLLGNTDFNYSEFIFKRIADT